MYLSILICILHMKYYIIYEIKFIIQISKLYHFIEQMSAKNIEDNQFMKEYSVFPSYVLSSCYSRI